MDTVPDDGGRFELTEDDADAWVAAVNDIRLTLGVMLEIGPEGPERLPADHPLAVHFDVYQWLTVLQEYLVLALMGVPSDHRRRRHPRRPLSPTGPGRVRWAPAGPAVSPSC